MKQTVFTTFLIIMISCSGDVQPEQQPFVGTWFIKKVVYDGSIKPEWESIKFAIEQNEINKGIYQMTNTLYDSIWNSAGIWSIDKEASKLVFDDTLTVDFAHDDDILGINKWIKSSAGSECHPTEEIPCTLGLTGFWTFTFEME